eukprot:13991693-Ditylum_brightwellii.AAC.1
MKTNRMIQKVLLFKIQQWCGVDTNPPHIPSDKLGDILTDATADQHKLRWDNMIKGMISKKWGLAQEVRLKVFKPNNTRQTKIRWEKELILLLWN